MVSTVDNLRGSRRIAAVAFAVALIAAGCGGGGDDDSDAASGSTRPAPTSADSGSGENEPDDGAEDVAEETAGADLAELEALLPEEAVAPDGFEMLAGKCMVDEGPTPGWFTYAVPSGYVQAGASSAGSGGPLGDETEAKYETDSGYVTVAISVDQRNGEGNVVDDDGEETESFDYLDGDDTVTFDAVATLTVADRQVELMKADGDEAEYRAQVEALLLPSFADPAEQSSAVIVVTISHDTDVVLTEDEIGAIVESLSMPACTMERITIQQEMMHQVDLDGDGTVATIEDLMAPTQG